MIKRTLKYIIPVVVPAAIAIATICFYPNEDEIDVQAFDTEVSLISSKSSTYRNKRKRPFVCYIRQLSVRG